MLLNILLLFIPYLNHCHTPEDQTQNSSAGRIWGKVALCWPMESGRSGQAGNLQASSTDQLAPEKYMLYLFWFLWSLAVEILRQRNNPLYKDFTIGWKFILFINIGWDAWFKTRVNYLSHIEGKGWYYKIPIISFLLQLKVKYCLNPTFTGTKIMIIFFC